MRPTTDSERIRFRKEAGSRYRLVHEGTLEGSSNLSCVVRLVEEEMGVKLERKGYVGHGGHSSQTLQSQEPIDTRAFAGKIRRLLRLPLKELAAIVRARQLLGPKDGELGFAGFDERTDAFALKRWSLHYYAANGIDCPESRTALERHSQFRLRYISISLLLHNFEASFQTPLKVEVYRQLLEKGAVLPPLICLRRGWDLLEGYHRLAAHQHEGSADVPCIVIGTG